MTDIALDGNALAACPFCGGEAAVRSNSEKGRAWVSCDSCGAESGGYEDFEVAMGILCFKAAVEWNRRASPSQVAPQPQAGEALPKNTRRFKKLSTVDDDVASPQPANPAQVTDAEGWKRAFAAQSRKLEAVLHIPGVKEALAELRWPDTTALAAIGAGGQAVTEEDQVLDAVLSCPHSIDTQSVVLKVDYDKPGNALKQLHERIISALSQPHPADERVVEALRMAHSFIAREYRDEKSIALEGEFVSKEARPVFRALSDALAAKEGR